MTTERQLFCLFSPGCRSCQRFSTLRCRFLYQLRRERQTLLFQQLSPFLPCSSLTSVMESSEQVMHFLGAVRGIAITPIKKTNWQFGNRSQGVGDSSIHPEGIELLPIVGKLRHGDKLQTA